MKEKYMSKKRFSIIQFVILLILVIAIGYYIYIKYFYTCIGCKTTKCASAFDCECVGKTCTCTYYDEYNNPSKIECPNNNYE